MALLAPGQTVALAEGAYFGTGVTLREFEPWGLRVVEFDQTGAPPPADVTWVEAPANPVLTMPDWDLVRGRGVVVCDATLATPVYLHALDEAADIVLHSATKYLTGQSDAMLGVLVTRDTGLLARLRDVRTRIGLHAAPDAAGALLRGLEDLDGRLRRQTATATEIARRLAAHPAVGLVRYPGFAGVISFDVAGDPLSDRDQHEGDPQPDITRRREDVDGKPPPLGRRPDPARPAAPVGRARGRRRDLGRPQAGTRECLESCPPKRIAGTGSGPHVFAVRRMCC